MSPSTAAARPSPEPIAQRRGGPVWRLITTAVWVALVAELIVLSTHALFGWWATTPQYAATPPPLAFHAPQPPSAARLLQDLAAVAARQPAPRAGRSARYAYVSTRRWSLARVPDGGTIPSRVIPTVTESWRAPDGAGRVLTQAAGRAARQTTLGAGEPLAALPAAPAALATLLHARGASAQTATPFVAFTALAASRPIPPAVEAAILRVLASLPDLINSGTVTDRAGRAGTAISIDGDQSGPLIRYTLVFDPSSGRLLEADQTLEAESGGPLHVQEGAVIGYTLMLSGGYAANTMTTP